MRALKLVGIAIGGLVVLIVLALLAVRLFVDPNDYKGRIEQTVKTSTGRDLILSGPIKLSVFPWIALEIGPASLGNPPGFGNEPFAAVKHAAFRVKLLPLLRKQLEIGRVEIDGLDLRLRKNAAGKGNWQDFGGSTTQPEAPTQTATGPGTLPDLAGVDITNSRLSYQDTVADHVNLELGHLTADKPVPVKLKLDLTTGQGAKPIDINGQLVATLDPRTRRYRIAPLEIQGTLSPASRAGAGPVAWKFAIPELDVDLGAQTLSIPSFNAELAAARLAGKLQGSKIVDAPAVSGSFKLDPVSLRGLATKLGIALPPTRDPKALTRLAAQGDFTYGANAMAARSLAIQLDDSRLTGNVAVTNLTAKATRFDLTLDRINLDNYRSPEAPANAGGAQPGKTSAGGQSSTDMLKTLDMNGTLRIGAATVAALNVSQVLVTIAAKDGVTHISPAKAQLYGGAYSGDITLDDRNSAAPSLKLDQSLTNIDVAALLKDFAKKSQHISGRGTVTTNLTTHAMSGDALLKTLNGHVVANVDNGAIEGIDLWFEINRAMALIQKQSMPAGNSSGRTRFDAFKASADITNGVASTKDLNIASQNLRVTGQGTTNLVTDAINYQVKATLLKEAPGATKVSTNTLADIPLDITGTLSNPSVRPDLEGMAKARVQQELDKRKGQLQQQLMDKLKGILK